MVVSAPEYRFPCYRNRGSLRQEYSLATLKYPAADLDSSLYDPERQLNTHVIELLAKGDWIDEPNNLLITGGAGAGKTHVACALCVTALHQMRTVKYIRANYLLQESAHAHSEDNYYEYSNKMAGYDLLVRFISITNYTLPS